MGYLSTVVKLGRLQQCDGGGCHTGTEGGIDCHTFLDEGSNCAWPLSDPVPESGKFYRRELPYKKDTGGAPGSRLPGIARVASRF